MSHAGVARPARKADITSALRWCSAPRRPIMATWVSSINTLPISATSKSYGVPVFSFRKPRQNRKSPLQDTILGFQWFRCYDTKRGQMGFGREKLSQFPKGIYPTDLLRLGEVNVGYWVSGLSKNEWQNRHLILVEPLKTKLIFFFFSIRGTDLRYGLWSMLPAGKHEGPGSIPAEVWTIIVNIVWEFEYNNNT